MPMNVPERVRSHPAVERLREAEVADLDPPFVFEEAIGRLDVAVDQAELVELSEPLDDVEDLDDGTGGVERTCLLDQRLEGRALASAP